MKNRVSSTNKFRIKRSTLQTEYDYIYKKQMYISQGWLLIICITQIEQFNISVPYSKLAVALSITLSIKCKTRKNKAIKDQYIIKTYISIKQIESKT